MSKIKPNLGALDGVHPKSDDFNRLLTYTTELLKGLGGAFNPGILYGLTLRAVDSTNLRLSAGSAIASTGDIIIVETGEIMFPIATVIPYFFGTPNLGDIWLYWKRRDDEVTREDDTGALVTVAYKDVYEIDIVAAGSSPSFDTPCVKIGTTKNLLDSTPSTLTETQFISLFSWDNTANYINYHYALESLTHTGTINSNGKFTGPKIGAGALANDAVSTATIQDGAVTASKIASGIDGAKILDGTIDATTKVINLAYSGSTLKDYTIKSSKLVRSMLRRISLPTVYTIPIAEASGSSYGSSYVSFNAEDPAINGFQSRDSFTGSADVDGFMLDSGNSERRFSQHLDWLHEYGVSDNPENNILFSSSPIADRTDPYLILLGRIDSAFHRKYSPEQPNIWYPEYAKISNYIARSAGYPDRIEISGRWPYLRPFESQAFGYSADFNTYNSNSDYFLPWGPGVIFSSTPYIIPPDGYVIDHMELTLGLTQFYENVYKFPYYAPVIEYETLTGPSYTYENTTTYAAWNPTVPVRLANKGLMGTKVRGIVGYWGVAENVTLPNPVNIRITLKYVNPGAKTPDNPYGISFNYSGFSAYDNNIYDDAVPTDGNPIFYLKHKVSVWGGVSGVEWIRGTEDGVLHFPEFGPGQARYVETNPATLYGHPATKLWRFLDRTSVI